ncbi:MAG: hypothetical protein WC492_00905 [Candidatus Micrarchaeia archaeon]
MKQKNNAKIFALFAIVLFALPMIVHAQEDETGKWGTPLPAENEKFQFFFLNWAGAGKTNWTGMAMIAIAICLFANALLLVAGKVLNMPRLEKMAESEFFQSSASAMMIVGLCTMVAFAFTLLAEGQILPKGTTTQCMGTPVDVWEESPFAIIQCKLQDKITYTEDLFNRAIEADKVPEVLSSSCIFVFGVPVYCGDWDVATHAKMEKCHYIANRMVPLGISLHAQYMFVDYLANNMMSIFLPLGILLRIFPPLRGIGGLFIGIAIGFYIVFPVTYILLDPTTVKPDPAALIPVDDAQLNQCYTSFSGMVSLNTVSNLKSATTGSKSSPDIDEVGLEIASLQVETFFNPLAALAATMLFINALAPVLGGDTGNMLHFLAKTV